MARHYGCVNGFIYGTNQPEPKPKDDRDSARKPCVVCGKPLPRLKSKYCSYECARLAEAEKMRKWREDNPEEYAAQKMRQNERRRVEAMRKWEGGKR